MNKAEQSICFASFLTILIKIKGRQYIRKTPKASKRNVVVK